MKRVLISVTPVSSSALNSKSPVIFIHGFPDSPHIFKDYYSAKEQRQTWLRNRDAYTISFMNRHQQSSLTIEGAQSGSAKRPGSGADQCRRRSASQSSTKSQDSSASEKELEMIQNAPPTLFELSSGLLQRHFNAAIFEVIDKSPTGKVVLVAHDWGATYTWQFLKDYVKEHHSIASVVEFYVALSVGSTLRYDVWEHGWRAFLWLYSSLFCLPFYFPNVDAFKRVLWTTLTLFAGYKAKSPPNEYVHHSSVSLCFSCRHM